MVENNIAVLRLFMSGIKWYEHVVKMVEINNENCG